MMSSSGPNPVLAPIRRWVLYSRTNLAITVLGVFAFLFVVGAVFGEGPPPKKTKDPAAEAATELVAASVADAINYELVEVTESQIVNTPAKQIAANAPATAMAYAHAFVNSSTTDSKWAKAIGQLAADKPGDTVKAARPQTPVAITGPTVSKFVDNSRDRSVEVYVPTQAGDMRISLSVKDISGGRRWVVNTPLPTLDLSKVAEIAPPTTSKPATSATPKTPTTATPTAPSTTTTPATSSTRETPQTDASDSGQQAEPSAPRPSRGADPVPVTGPIPIPDLDTPIPGGR